MMRASAILAGTVATGRQALLAAPASTSAASHAFQDDIETDVQITIPFNPFGQPITVDPHRTVNWGPFWVMMPYVWSGLLRFDENGAVQPDLAESVEPNEDGTVWTAVIKEGIAYANGDPILAEHFIASWNRALDHMQLSPMAQFMEPVQGYADVVAGTGAQLGVTAIDDRTIEIALTRPVSHFPSSLATFVWAVMNPAYIDPPEGTEPSLADASAGPWKITEFDDISRIVMVPNEHYWGSQSPSVTGIVWHILPGGGTDQAALDLYTQEDAVTADVPSSVLPIVQEDASLAAELVEIQDHASTLAISMDFHQAPFDDVRVRRAIAAAVDKDAWASDIQAGAYVPATSFTPPVLKTIANYEAPAAPELNPDDAPDLLEQAGIDPANLGTEIIYFQPATDTPEQMEQAQQLLDMIEASTGIAITHDTNLTREQITALRQDNGGLQFDLVQWWLASNTPSLLETVAAQDSAYNAGWINWEPELESKGDFTPGEDAATFNDLVVQADAELDEAARNELYAEAESLLLKNAVYVPLGYWVQRFLQKPWLQGTRQGPWSGNIPVRIDENVVVRGRPAVE
jgi:oligopeptide transport system substrate-binding protein